MDFIQFEKIEYGNIACFLCNDGGWQLNKELGFHKISSARDYHVQWIENNGKWSLYITNYIGNYNRSNNELTEIIITVDTIYEVINYICKNKNTHY
jgi:hypothetical protein